VRTTVHVNGAAARLALRPPHPRRWSPDAPHLYGFRFRLRHHGQLLDEVWSYAGLRDIQLRDGRFLLNGQDTFLAMVMDQGYWPDGLLAAPSDAALRADVE